MNRRSFLKGVGVGAVVLTVPVGFIPKPRFVCTQHVSYYWDRRHGHTLHQLTLQWTHPRDPGEKWDYAALYAVPPTPGSRFDAIQDLEDQVREEYPELLA